MQLEGSQRLHTSTSGLLQMFIKEACHPAHQTIRLYGCLSKNMVACPLVEIYPFYKQWNCQVHCFLFIHLFVNINDLHNIRIMRAIKHFFIHLCYTEKFTNKYLLNFYPILNQTLMGWSFRSWPTLQQTYMNIGVIRFEIS